MNGAVLNENHENWHDSPPAFRQVVQKIARAEAETGEKGAKGRQIRRSLSLCTGKFPLDKRGGAGYNANNLKERKTGHMNNRFVNGNMMMDMMMRMGNMCMMMRAQKNDSPSSISV